MKNDNMNYLIGKSRLHITFSLAFLLLNVLPIVFVIEEFSPLHLLGDAHRWVVFYLEPLIFDGALEFRKLLLDHHPSLTRAMIFVMNAKWFNLNTITENYFNLFFLVISLSIIIVNIERYSRNLALKNAAVICIISLFTPFLVLRAYTWPVLSHFNTSVFILCVFYFLALNHHKNKTRNFFSLKDYLLFLSIAFSLFHSFNFFFVVVAIFMFVDFLVLIFNKEEKPTRFKKILICFASIVFVYTLFSAAKSHFGVNVNTKYISVFSDGEFFTLLGKLFLLFINNTTDFCAAYLNAMIASIIGFKWISLLPVYPAALTFLFQVLFFTAYIFPIYLIFKSRDYPKYTLEIALMLTPFAFMSAALVFRSDLSSINSESLMIPRYLFIYLVGWLGCLLIYARLPKLNLVTNYTALAIIGCMIFLSLTFKILNFNFWFDQEERFKSHNLNGLLHQYRIFNSENYRKNANRVSCDAAMRCKSSVRILKEGSLNIFSTSAQEGLNRSCSIAKTAKLDTKIAKNGTNFISISGSGFDSNVVLDVRIGQDYGLPKYRKDSLEFRFDQFYDKGEFELICYSDGIEKVVKKIGSQI